MRDRAGPVRDRPCSFFVGGAGPCGGAAACRRPLCISAAVFLSILHACLRVRFSGGAASGACRKSADAVRKPCFRVVIGSGAFVRSPLPSIGGGLKSPVTVPAAVRCRRRWLYCAVRVRGMAVRPVIGRCAAGIKQRSRPERAASSFYVMRFEPLSGYNGFWSAEVI